MNPQNQPAANRARRRVIAIIITAVVIVALIGGLIVALVMNNNASTPSSTTQSDTTSTQKYADGTPVDSEDTQVDANEENTITFTDSGFQPQTLTVKKGTVVAVVNNSSTDVQFSSDDHPTHRKNPEMNLKTLAPDESATFTANTVGTHGFHDHIDDSKTGTLIVTE